MGSLTNEGVFESRLPRNPAVGGTPAQCKAAGGGANSLKSGGAKLRVLKNRGSCIGYRESRYTSDESRSFRIAGLPSRQSGFLFGYYIKDFSNLFSLE